MSNTVIEFTDRYGPGGAPSSLRGCFGDCEATGFVPVHRPEGAPGPASFLVSSGLDPEYVTAWYKAEAKDPTDDGWHFVPCPACRGTGRVSWLRTFLRIPRWLARGVPFTLFGPPDERRSRLGNAWLRFKVAYLVDLGLWRP